MNGVDRLSGKIIGLGATSVFFALLFGVSYRMWFLAPVPGRTILLAAAAIVWLSIAGLSAFFVKGARVATGMVLLQAVAVWAFLPEPFSFWSISGILLLAIFLWGGLARGRADLTNSLKVRFLHAAERAMPVMMTGLILFATLSFLGASERPDAAAPKSVLQFLFKSSDSLTARFIPGFSSGKSFDEVLHAIVASRLPEGTSSEVINRDVDKTRTAIEKATGISISGQNKFVDELYKISVAKLVSLPSFARVLTLTVIGFLIFGLIKGIAFFAVWVVVGLMLLFFEVLRAMNFFHIGSESVSQEAIIID